MKRLLKVLLVLVVLLLLAAIGGLFGLQFFVQSAKGVARIQSELGRALGVPLKIRAASLGWGGVELRDVQITSDGKPFLEAPSFTTEYQILPLLHREVVLRKMVLQSPTIVWTQNEEGKWVLPTRVKGPKPAPTEPVAPKAPKEKEFELALDTLEIRDGAITMLDKKGGRFAQMDSVQIKASLAHTENVTADVTAARVALLEPGPVFENVRLPFGYADGKLTFPKFEGTLGGGTVHGTLAIETKQDEAPFDLQLGIENVNLAQAIADPEWKIRSGQLQASLTLKGNSHEAERGTGRGEIHLKQASVDALEPLLRLIGEACHITELANLNLSLQSSLNTFAQTLGIPDVVSLREANTTFQLKEKETLVENLLVDGGDLSVGAKGTIGQDGKLNLQADLSVSEALGKKLPGFVRNAMLPVEGSSRRSIDFAITGKNNRPNTDLVKKLLGQQLDVQFGNIVQNLFGGSSKKKEKTEEEKAEKKKKDKDKDKDKEKAMGDGEKKDKGDKKDKEKQRQQAEAEMAKGASPDANAIPGQTPESGAPPTPATVPAAVTPAAPATAPAGQ